MLNLNWEKFHSIILSVSCHGLRNVSIHEFSKPYEWGGVVSYMGVVCWSESYRGGVGWVMQ